MGVSRIDRPLGVVSIVPVSYTLQLGIGETHSETWPNNVQDSEQFSYIAARLSLKHVGADCANSRATPHDCAATTRTEENHKRCTRFHLSCSPTDWLCGTGLDSQANCLDPQF